MPYPPTFIVRRRFSRLQTIASPLRAFGRAHHCRNKSASVSRCGFRRLSIYSNDLVGLFLLVRMKPPKLLVVDAVQRSSVRLFRLPARLVCSHEVPQRGYVQQGFPFPRVLRLHSQNFGFVSALLKFFGSSCHYAESSKALHHDRRLTLVPVRVSEKKNQRAR